MRLLKRRAHVAALAAGRQADRHVAQPGQQAKLACKVYTIAATRATQR
jgi:hypothetical protein